MEKVIKEKLYQVILDLESEQTEIEKQIQDHKDEILQANRYLQSLYEKEDADVRIFSPRNIESRYKEDILKGKGQIRAFEKENQVLYHKQNLIKKRISALREVWQEFGELLSTRQQPDNQALVGQAADGQAVNENTSDIQAVKKNDISVKNRETDREYAHWVLTQGKQGAVQSEASKTENDRQSFVTDAGTENQSEVLQDDKADMLHIVQALDNDRKRIASDLHDTIVQDLVHTIHMVELCGKYMEQDFVQAKLELALIEQNLRETIQKARNFISDLRPMIFDDFGFRGTLLNAVEDLQKYTSMMIVADVDDLPDIHSEKCIVLFRVAMELLRNAIFHSGGDKVSLTLKRENGVIQLKVVDNGKGLSMNDDTNKHFGLELVKERTYLIGATFHIESTDEGTCAQIILKE